MEKGRTGGEAECGEDEFLLTPLGLCKMALARRTAAAPLFLRLDLLALRM